ncbi:MAG TPA: hypothetical protein VLW65_06220 [Bryobacteraceae bacterium]|nr:hypothetical protein [Bryobacteraceae bacterium]
MKTYSAQSGYVYQYFYEGYRAYTSGKESGQEYVFRISPDRKSWHDTGVFLAEEAVRAWEAAHERTLNSTERYAVAKVALFQAFDERSAPAQMKEGVRVRPADVEGIIENLGL